MGASNQLGLVVLSKAAEARCNNLWCQPAVGVKKYDKIGSTDAKAL